MSAASVEKWRRWHAARSLPFPPEGAPLPPSWVWVVGTSGRPAHCAQHPTAPLEVRGLYAPYRAFVDGRILRGADRVYYADGASGKPCRFPTAFDAASAAWTYWQESTRRRLDPAATYVEVESAPGLRWEQSSTPAGEGFVWLRPAFVAVRVPVEMVEPWR